MTRFLTSLAGIATILAVAMPLEALAARLYITKSGLGTVTGSPGAIACGSTCEGRFVGGTIVTLDARPATGYAFSSWSGDCEGTAVTNILLTTRTYCTANFVAVTPPPITPSQFNLSVTASGTGVGVVTSNPAGISCGTTCQSAYAANTTITLSAVASTGSTFTGWSGNCAGTSSAASIVLSADSTCTATFAAVSPTPSPQYTLTMTKSGTGSGVVTSNPTGISCGTTCQASYAANTAITLTAVADTSSVFTGWSGSCSGTSTAATISLSANSTCTANFATVAPTQYTLVVTRSGTGAGVVTSNPTGISCGTTCQSTYAANTAVSLTAVASTGSAFTGWSGSCSGTSTAATISLSANSTCTANFATVAPTQYTLFVTRSGTGAGVVTSNPTGISCGTTCQSTYAANTAVSLTAVASTGSAFTGWSGSCTGTASVANITVTATGTCFAVFDLVSPPPVCP